MKPTDAQLELLRRASGLTLDAEGDLRHEGDPIVHPGLHALFQSGLDALPTGEAIVRIGDQWAYVQTPGTPFVVQRQRVNGDAVSLDLNTGETLHVPAQDLKLHLEGEHNLTLKMPQNGSLPAFWASGVARAGRWAGNRGRRRAVAALGRASAAGGTQLTGEFALFSCYCPAKTAKLRAASGEPKCARSR